MLGRYTECGVTESTISSTRSGGGPVMMSTIDEERIKLFDDLELKSQGMCENNNEVQVQLRSCDGNHSTSIEQEECLLRNKVQSVQQNVQKMNHEGLSMNNTEVRSVLSTGMVEASTACTHTHCKKVKEIESDHKVMKSTKGEFSKLLVKQRLWGLVIYCLNPN